MNSLPPFGCLSPDDADWISQRFGKSADWIFCLLDKLDKAEVHHIIESARSSAPMEIAPATGYTSVSDPWAAETFPAAPSSAALSFQLEAPSSPADPAPSPPAPSSTVAAPTAPASPEPSPTALSSLAAAPSNMADQDLSNVDEQPRRTVNWGCPITPCNEFRILRNSLAKNPMVPDKSLLAKKKERGRGRPKKVGHMLDPRRSSRFYVQLDKADMCMLVIPSKFRKQINGSFPRPVKLKLCPECAWSVRMELDEKNGEMAFRDGWLEFSKGQELQADDVLVFQIIDESLFKVYIYDGNTSTQRVIFCADHPY